MQKINSLLQKEILYPEVAFICFRLLFGIYLAYYFFASLPYAVEVYSKEGMIPDPLVSLNMVSSLFPNILYYFDSPLVIKITTLVGAFSAFSFAFGVYPRAASLLLWYIQTSFFGRNPLTSDPSLAYTGLLLITLTLLPRTPSLFVYLRKENQSLSKKMSIPYFLFFMPLFIFAISFCMSAINKMQAKSWLNGEALRYILQLPLAEHTTFTTLLIHTSYVVIPLSFLALFSQLVVLPLFLAGEYRSSLYISLFEFFFAFIVLKINQVTLGMLFFFLFFIVRDLDIEKMLTLLKNKKLIFKNK